MSLNYQPDGTRIWWDGSEVAFIGWTDKALLFSWCDARETAVQMPRGVVFRLLQKGVLRIEGEVPSWLYVDEPLPGLYPAAPQPRPASADNKNGQRAEKLSIISRIIRKLSGGEASSTRGQNMAKTAAAAVPASTRSAARTAPPASR
jgi:hypothetical protein